MERKLELRTTNAPKRTKMKTVVETDSETKSIWTKVSKKDGVNMMNVISGRGIKVSDQETIIYYYKNDNRNKVYFHRYNAIKKYKNI